MASEGPNSASTIVDDDSVGSVEWSNPGNAGASDDSRAIADIGILSDSHYLKFTGFGFSIPLGVTIEGVALSLERRRGTGVATIRDKVVRLVVGGTVVGDNKADTGTDWPASDAAAGYGGAADTWGLSPTAAQVNANDFGFVVQARNPAGGGAGSINAEVDHGTLSVTYSGIVVSLSPLSTEITVVGPALKVGANVPLGVLSVDASVPTQAVQTGAGITVALPALIAEASVPAVTVSTGKTIVIRVGMVAALAHVPLMSVALGSDAFPPVLQAKATLVAPEIQSGVTIRPSPVAAEAAIPAPTVSKGIVIEPAPLVVAASVPVVGVNAPLLEQICLCGAAASLIGSTLEGGSLVGSTLEGGELVECCE